MTDDAALASRLSEVLCAAKRRARARFVSDALIDEIARGMAPVLRELVREAVADALGAPAALPNPDPFKAMPCATYPEDHYGARIVP